MSMELSSYITDKPDKESQMAEQGRAAEFARLQQHIKSIGAASHQQRRAMVPIEHRGLYMLPPDGSGLRISAWYDDGELSRRNRLQGHTIDKAAAESQPGVYLTYLSDKSIFPLATRNTDTYTIHAPSAETAQELRVGETPREAVASQLAEVNNILEPMARYLRILSALQQLDYRATVA